ncbi:MAG: hypothetical protein LKE40_14800 [Spirochaetia bacterium]|nr:hypothetical protein [Spirochaetia bacterium]
MKKKYLTVLALLLLLPSMVFATEVAITWEWMQDDPNVTWFRYQLDGQDSSKWTVVPADTTSYTVQHLDGSKSYTLYLQQSYDGMNWSGSSNSVAKAYDQPVEEAAAPVQPVADEQVAAAASTETAKAASTAESESAASVAEKTEQPAETEAQPAVASQPEEVPAVLTEPAAEQPAAAPVVATEEAPVVSKKKSSGFAPSISLNAGALWLSDDAVFTAASAGAYESYAFQAGGIIGLNRIVSLGSNLSLGIDLRGDLIGYMPTGGSVSDLEFSGRLTFIPELEYTRGRFVAKIGPLLGLNVGGTSSKYHLEADIDTDYSDHFALEYGASLGLGYKLTDHLMLNLQAEARHATLDRSVTEAWYFGGGLGIGYTF